MCGKGECPDQGRRGLLIKHRQWDSSGCPTKAKKSSPGFSAIVQLFVQPYPVRGYDTINTKIIKTVFIYKTIGIW